MSRICQFSAVYFWYTSAYMTYGTWLLEATDTLQLAGSKTPRLDALVLLEHISGHSRAQVLSKGSEALSAMRRGKLQKLLNRRAQGEPMAYILGQKEFYGRDFAVSPLVLVPRPESEDFISLLGELRQTERIHSVVDIGTGSGNLAVTAKLEFPDMYVFASDTSTGALRIAAQNSMRHNAPVTFKEQSLLHGDKEGYDVVIANLPYVPTGPEPDPSIAFEPVEALFSGFDGLEHYRQLFAQLTPKHIRFVMTESLLSQHDAVQQLADEAGYSLTRTQGLIQLFTKSTTL